MPTALAPLVRQVEARARRVLDALLEAPTVPLGTLERVAARKLNDQRRTAVVRNFVEGAYRRFSTLGAGRIVGAPLPGLRRLPRFLRFKGEPSACFPAVPRRR